MFGCHHHPPFIVVNKEFQIHLISVLRIFSWRVKIFAKLSVGTHWVDVDFGESDAHLRDATVTSERQTV